MQRFFWESEVRYICHMRKRAAPGGIVQLMLCKEQVFDLLIMRFRSHLLQIVFLPKNILQ
jgi:hypothetical protein